MTFPFPHDFLCLMGQFCFEVYKTFSIGPMGRTQISYQNIFSLHILLLIILTTSPAAQQSVFFCHIPLILSKHRLCLVQLTSGVLLQAILFGVSQKFIPVGCQAHVSRVFLLCTILSSAPTTVPGIKQVLSIY